MKSTGGLVDFLTLVADCDVQKGSLGAYGPDLCGFGRRLLSVAFLAHVCLFCVVRGPSIGSFA